MSGYSHTPGPWRISDDSRTIEGWDGENIGGCVVSRMIEANAQLIAKAPSMFLALTDIVEYCDGTRGPANSTETILETILKTARKALTGEGKE